jgi:hypothetical protein
MKGPTMRVLFIAVALLLSATTAASAQRIFPPPEYDRYYEGDLTIKIVDTLEELHEVCQLEGKQLLACSTRNHSSCIIVMVKDEVMRTRNWTTGSATRWATATDGALTTLANVQ